MVPGPQLALSSEACCVAKAIVIYIAENKVELRANDRRALFLVAADPRHSSFRLAIDRQGRTSDPI